VDECEPLPSGLHALQRTTAVWPLTSFSSAHPSLPAISDLRLSLGARRSSTLAASEPFKVYGIAGAWVPVGVCCCLCDSEQRHSDSQTHLRNNLNPANQI
jgi:hypothetical protein